MQYDGSIRIDTRIDERGFNTGVASMQKILLRIGRLVATTFAVAAIVAFGRTAVQAASETASAMVGLQSVAEGVGTSFADAHEFIKDFTADGLVPATNAVNAYKNLLLRGYDTSQIEGVLTALKDSAAFGRQGRLSMGEAIESASEGLKNENSLLVDNAGVTKNVAKMWRDYAASIGTTVGALTQQQKIDAEYQGILQETRFQTGDAAKLAGTYAGQLSALGVSFYNLKVGIGNVIIPIAQRVMPYIKAAIDLLTVFANRLASIMSILFGVDIGAARQSMDAVADASNAAADGQANLAKQTEKAGKAAKGALAPFDELNVLEQPDTSGTGDAAGVGGMPAAGAASPFDSQVIDEQLEELKAKVEAWKQSFLAAIQPVTDALGRLGDALSPLKDFAALALINFYNEFLVPVGTWVLGEGLPRFVDAIANGLMKVDWENINASLVNLWDSLAPFAVNVGEGLLWLWENVLVPFGTWVLNDAVPVFLDLLSGAIDVLNSVLDALEPLGKWLWEEFLQPIAEWSGEKLLEALGWVTEKLEDFSGWIDDNQGTVETLVVVVGSLAAGFWLLYAALQAYTLITGIATAVSTGFAAIMAIVSSPIFLIGLAIGAIIAVIVLLIRHWDEVSKATVLAVENIKYSLNRIGLWFKENVFEPISRGFNTLLDSLSVGWQRTWDGIKGFVKNTVNGIIDLINGMLRAVAGGLNAVIGGMNSLKVNIPDWVPNFGGKSFGLSIPTVGVPQIPRLARGAVIPPNAEFLAVLGDQRNGNNIEAPQALLEQMLERAVAGAQGSQQVTINFTGSMAELVRILKPKIDQEYVRADSSLVSSGGAA
ncbi:MAG: hypothetical protein KF821_01860 [Anaerolineales bacterium]|nr:hypothetical protein [Anaerolineales bacterium]